MSKTKPQFETVKLPSGNYGWRMRDSEGKIVSIKPGKIMGIEVATKRRPLQRALQQILENRTEVGAADNGG